jgi:flagellar biosynthetic protein FliP
MSGIYQDVQFKPRRVNDAGLRHYTGAHLAGDQIDNDNFPPGHPSRHLAPSNIILVTTVKNAQHRSQPQHCTAPPDHGVALRRPAPGRAYRWAAGCIARLVASGIPVILALIFSSILAHPAIAQSVSLDLGTNNSIPDPGETAKLVQIVAGIGILSLAPSLLVMMTAFTRIVIVLSILRNALGTQTTPPNMVLIGLALFLTYFVMQPTLELAWQNGLLPMSNGTLDTITGLQAAAAPFHSFMAANARPDDVGLFLNLGHMPPPATADDTPWRALIPAFAIGELRRGFEMGFLIYLPFLVIDLVISSILMSLGMMMLPPTAVSMPFKLIFFVLVNGWQLVCGSLVQSFAPPH